jgi:hypothetical protein
MCQKLRAKFLQASMGPRDPSSYCIAPAFWVAQADLFGPMTTYVPGRERNTRAHPALPAKCWAMVFCCVLTKAVNIQVVEGHSANCLADGLTRLSCETGTPARLLIDRDSAFMQVLREGEIEIVDLETQMRSRTQVDFQLCPVSGHNQHGLVESKINVIQTGLRKIGVEKERLHATGLQTFLKLVECDMNSCPFGVTMGRSEHNSPLLKLISPNQMRIGRINARTPAGPFKLPSGPKDMICRVQEVYEQWYNVFNDSLVPVLLAAHQPKWFTADKDLATGDVVYFRKGEGSAIKGPWTMGLVDSTTKGRDLVIRRVSVKYFNCGEEHPQYTDRAIRSLVRLFNVDETPWQEDLDKVRRICDSTGLSLADPDIRSFVARDHEVVGIVPSSMDCQCCCLSHHGFCLEETRPTRFKMRNEEMMPGQVLCTSVPMGDYEVEDQFLDVAGDDDEVVAYQDGFLSAMLSLGCDMSYR